MSSGSVDTKDQEHALLIGICDELLLGQWRHSFMQREEQDKKTWWRTSSQAIISRAEPTAPGGMPTLPRVVPLVDPLH